MTIGYNLESGVEAAKSVEDNMKGNMSTWLKSVKFGVKQSVNEFCKNTTLHGLSYLANKELYPMERYTNIITQYLILKKEVFMGLILSKESFLK